MSKCTALIVAAGRGSRFGNETPKQYCHLYGDTVLGLTLKAFARHPNVSAIRVVIHPDDIELYKDVVDNVSWTGKTILLAPVYGGVSRQESVFLGLESLSTSGTETTPDIVLIHDAARPFISESVIDRVLAALQNHTAVIPALAVNDTLKRKRDAVITGTIDRSELVRVQTPQGFHYSEILTAHRHIRAADPNAEMTDDAAIAECAGISVNIVEGDEGNIKITSQQDIMNNQPKETRIGTGFDVHRFEEGDGVTLCGICVPHTASLAGHSDADVGLHALTDALLGAVGEGDIGVHFPPSDPQWKGVVSHAFVKKACDLIARRGGQIINVDVTLICEHPKIDPYRVAMTESIAVILEIEPGRVSVKATTTERLGFTGRNEGIAAQAIASIELPKG